MVILRVRERDALRGELTNGHILTSDPLVTSPASDKACILVPSRCADWDESVVQAPGTELVSIKHNSMIRVRLIISVCAK